MRKIKINPKYEYLKDFLESIPDVFEKKGLYNLRRFWGPKEFTRILVSEYALLRNIDTDKAVAYVMKERARFWTKYGKKHEIPFQLEL